MESEGDGEGEYEGERKKDGCIHSGKGGDHGGTIEAIRIDEDERKSLR